MAITLSDLPYTALESIFSSLADHPASLAHLIRVSRMLYLTVTASLYRHVSVNLHTLPLFIESLTSEKCQHVRTLSVFNQLSTPRVNTLHAKNRCVEACLSGCVKMLIPKVKQMQRLNTFSFRVWRGITPHFINWDETPSLSSNVLAELVSILPETCVSLELDCAWPLVDGREHHHCQAIQKVLPRLEHLRLRLSTYCPELLAAESFVHAQLRWRRLKTLVVHVLQRFNPGVPGPPLNSCSIGWEGPLLKAVRDHEVYIEKLPALRLLNLVDGGPFDHIGHRRPPDQVTSSYVHGNRGGINLHALPIRQIVHNSTLLVPFELLSSHCDRRGQTDEWELYCRTQDGGVCWGNVDEILSLIDRSPWITQDSGSRRPIGDSFEEKGEDHKSKDRRTGGSCSTIRALPTSPKRSFGPPDDSLMHILEQDESLTGQIHLKALEVEGLDIVSSLTDVLPEGWELDPEYYADLADSDTRIRKIEAPQWTHAVP